MFDEGSTRARCARSAEPRVEAGSSLADGCEGAAVVQRDSTTRDDHESEALEAFPLAVLRIDRHGDVVAANAAWRRLSGLDGQASLGDGWTRVVAGAEALCGAWKQSLRTAGSGSDDHQLCLDESRQWSRWWWRADGDGLLVAVASIDEDKQREEQLWFSATHDCLTKLTNRAEFIATLERALHRGRRRQQPPAVIYIDLDDFKAVNDSGGHLLGDEVLRSVARRVSDAVRPADVAARIGGDEFAVVCEDLTGDSDLQLVADRIRSAVEHQVVAGGRAITVRATTGAVVAEIHDDAESLLARADLAMYEQKRRGGAAAQGAGLGGSSSSERDPEEPTSSEAEVELAGATKALEDASRHLHRAWTTAVGDEETRELGERISRAARFAQSANRLLSSEVLV